MPKTPSFRCSTRNIAFFALPSDVQSVDVDFDGHRVWSVDLRGKKDGHPFDWPEQLAKRLKGSSLITISDSATKNVLAKQEAVFSDEKTAPNFTNREGVNLSINKWGRLAPDLVAIGPKVQELILDRSEEIVKHLQDADLRPFVVGGTLLGGVRDGALLPHDDDADIAYLSKHTNPFDVAREGYRVGKMLEDLGFSVMRHSATHMQLHFTNDAKHVEYYIDVFAAFFTNDGKINQPFHVRGPFNAEQMLPFGEVTISGRKFPSPADTDSWLNINYDENWRTPIPGFEIVTPEPTVRRFNNWFGTFNSERHFWNDWYSGDDPANIWQESHSWVLQNSNLLQSKTLLDLASGSGDLAEQLATNGRTVVMTDFARAPLELCLRRSLQNDSLKARHLNLYRLNTVALPKALGFKGSFDVVASHVFDELGKEARKNTLRLIRMALKSGGNAVAVFSTVPKENFSHEDPTTWHVDPLELGQIATELGLQMTLLERFDAPGQPIAVSFGFGAKPFEYEQERTPKQMIKRILKSIDPRITRRRVNELQREIDELKKEIDEYRSHASEFAQLMEMAEETFGSEKE